MTNCKLLDSLEKNKIQVFKKIKNVYAVFAPDLNILMKYFLE